MGTVMVALVPITAWSFYLFGWPALYLWAVTILSSVLFEALAISLRKRSIWMPLGNGSALLAGWLLALSLPPWAPWWIGVVGAGTAILLGKHAFGGLGQNPFNPAMVGRVVLLIAFPVEMTMWPNATVSSPVRTGWIHAFEPIFWGVPSHFDALTGATTLGLAKEATIVGHELPSALLGAPDIWPSLMGVTSGSMGETAVIWVLCGGILMMFRNVISWHIPISIVGGMLLIAVPMHVIDPTRYLHPLTHLCSGGLVFAAFFIFTDMVTSPTSVPGKLIYGLLSGATVWTLRTYSSFPESIAFVVLLMNAITPLIDSRFRPRVYGRYYNGKALESLT